MIHIYYIQYRYEFNYLEYNIQVQEKVHTFQVENIFIDIYCR